MVLLGKLELVFHYSPSKKRQRQLSSGYVTSVFCCYLLDCTSLDLKPVSPSFWFCLMQTTSCSCKHAVFVLTRDTELPECRYCPRSLAHSFSHFSLIYPPHRSQIPRFSQPIEKGFGNKSGLTFGVSSPWSGGDSSRDTQLSTEARDETALIIIVTTLGVILGKWISYE